MRRALVAGVGAGLLVTTVPALAGTDAPTATASEATALAVLDRAARAGRVLPYSGTQYVAAWQDGTTGATLVDVEHQPGHDAVVTAAPTAGGPDVPAVATPALDDRLVALLARSYDLAVAGPGRCTGRDTTVVEAREQGRVAGRFWVDRDSGLLLRREVYDEQGRRVRSSAFVDLEVGRARPQPAPALTARPVEQDAGALRAQGWQVPEELPHGMRLFETRLTGDRVLHLAYSDGLSTVSLFAQKGALGTGPMAGFAAEEVGDRPVWVRREAPERVVWSGGGRVWTLVSDAPADTVRAAVAALPRDPAPRDGLLARLGRGAARMLGALNPFD